MIPDWKQHITLDPAILRGKPTVRGLRISVEQIVRSLAAGLPESELLADYPELESDDLRACLAYAADVLSSERVYPVSTGA
jgi:uncharacterized protein (DUF433 family)